MFNKKPNRQEKISNQEGYNKELIPVEEIHELFFNWVLNIIRITIENIQDPRNLDTYKLYATGFSLYEINIIRGKQKICLLERILYFFKNFVLEYFFIYIFWNMFESGFLKSLLEIHQKASDNRIKIIQNRDYYWLSFYFGEKPEEDEPRCRIYLNPSTFRYPEIFSYICKRIISKLATIEGVKSGIEIKTIDLQDPKLQGLKGLEMIKEFIRRIRRSDKIVIYVSKSLEELILEILDEVYSIYEYSFKGRNIPLFTTPLRDKEGNIMEGISIAEDPKNYESFGVKVATALYKFIKYQWYKKPNSFNKFLELMGVKSSKFLSFRDHNFPQRFPKIANRCGL